MAAMCDGRGPRRLQSGPLCAALAMFETAGATVGREGDLLSLDLGKPVLEPLEQPSNCDYREAGHGG